MYDTKDGAAEQSIRRKVEDYSSRLEQNLIRKPDHCKICGHAGRLRWHGRYLRSVITMAETYRVTIRRLLCMACGHTFALLPQFIAKFHRYAKETIRLALKMLKSSTYEALASKFIAQAERCMAPLTLYLWRRKFA